MYLGILLCGIASARGVSFMEILSGAAFIFVPLTFLCILYENDRQKIDNENNRL